MRVKVGILNWRIFGWDNISEVNIFHSNSSSNCYNSRQNSWRRIQIHCWEIDGENVGISRDSGELYDGVKGGFRVCPVRDIEVNVQSAGGSWQ